MVKRTVGFDDYEGPQYEDYTGEEPPARAWFTGEVVRGKYDEDEDQMIFYVQVVDHPDYAGWTRGVYAPFEGDLKWKLQECLKAMQGGAEKAVTLDWANETAVANFIKKAKRVRFQTRGYEGKNGYVISIGKVRPLLNDASTPSAAKAAAPKTAPAPAPEPDQGEDMQDYTAEELAELEVADLEEIVTEEFEEELPAKPTRDRTGAKYKKVLVDLILEMQEEDADETDGDAAEGDDGFEDGFEEDSAPEPEPAPEPAPRARRSRAAAAKPEPAPEPAPTTRTRRTRR